MTSLEGRESQSSQLTADKRIASSTHSHIATGRKGVTDTISRIVDCEEFLLANESPGISHYSRLVRKWQTWQTRPPSAIGLSEESRAILHSVDADHPLIYRVLLGHCCCFDIPLLLLGLCIMAWFPTDWIPWNLLAIDWLPVD